MVDDTKHFIKEEFACRCGCGLDDISPLLVKMLEDARERAGIPFTVTSGCRCESHNKIVGGSPTSNHLKGEAVDISAGTGLKKYEITKALLDSGFVRVGVGKVFIHTDISKEKGKSIWTY